jgi:hypothetical protein
MLKRRGKSQRALPAYNQEMSLREIALAMLLVASAPLEAQTRSLNSHQPQQLMEQGANLGPGAAQDLEAQIEKNPEDLAARTKLLGYYYYQWMQPGEAAARAARRKHILWLIECHPDSPILNLAEAAIEESGNSLADPEGYKKARQLWLSQMDARKGDAALLGNLAKFFQMTDKNLAESALLQAKAIQPNNYEWDWRLGYLYGMGVLGVDALGLNGQPTSVNEIEASSPFAAKSRKALAESKSGTMLVVAAQIIWQYGAMLAPTEQGKLDRLEEAAKLVKQAKSAEPNNPGWTQFLAQIEAYRRQVLSPAPKPVK